MRRARRRRGALKSVALHNPQFPIGARLPLSAFRLLFSRRLEASQRILQDLCQR